MGEWETGRGQRVRWRLVVAVLAVGAVVFGAVWLRSSQGLPVVTGDEETDVVPGQVEVVVQPPASVGDRWLCPPNLAVKAYDDGGYYPPGHPGEPSFEVRPAACYRDPDAARAAGYTLAGPPPGVELVAGVYLEPPPEPLRRACAGAGARLEQAVPCPGALPYPAGTARCAWVSCVFADMFILEQRGFPVSDGWCPDALCDAHLVVAAGDPDARGASLLLTCTGEPLPRLPRADSRRLTTCPPGPPWVPGHGGYPHEGHTLVRWRDGDTVVAVSVEGHGADQAQLALALAERLTPLP